MFSLAKADEKISSGVIEMSKNLKYCFVVKWLDYR